MEGLYTDIVKRPWDVGETYNGDAQQSVYGGAFK